MTVVGGQPKKKTHENTSYKATKHIERTFLISVIITSLIMITGCKLASTQKRCYATGARMALSVSERPMCRRSYKFHPQISHPCFDFFPFCVA